MNKNFKKNLKSSGIQHWGVLINGYCPSLRNSVLFRPIFCLAGGWELYVTTFAKIIPSPQKTCIKNYTIFLILVSYFIQHTLVLRIQFISRALFGIVPALLKEKSSINCASHFEYKMCLLLWNSTNQFCQKYWKNI